MLVWGSLESWLEEIDTVYTIHVYSFVFNGTPWNVACFPCDTPPELTTDKMPDFVWRTGTYFLSGVVARRLSVNFCGDVQNRWASRNSQGVEDQSID